MPYQPEPEPEPETAFDRAGQVMARCDELAGCSEESDRLTRWYGTPALWDAQQRVAVWMAEAGRTVRRDPIGNLIGRYGGTRPDAKILLLGSHLDSVRDAGRYDGPLGVLAAIAVVARLHARGVHLPHPIEVVAFADEEGLRFHSLYLASRAFAGTLDPATLAATDADGVTVADAIRAFDGDPRAISRRPRDARDLLAYCEVHIEQGPVLEAAGLPLGVVTAFAGQSKVALTFTGEAGHAGTLPMPRRRDALCAAAEFVLAAEAVARATPDLVATVGQLAVEPGAGNVVPGRARLNLDLRHPRDDVRDTTLIELRQRAGAIAADRRVALDWRVVQENPAVGCDLVLSAALARAVAAAGYEFRLLASGAGHDGVALSAITRVAMLFVRCAGGISHNPAESVTTEDVGAALAALDHFVREIASSDAAWTLSGPT